MELDVLTGGRNLIKNSTPIILIEVSNNNKGKFLSWISNNDYRVHRTFELVHASNYLLLPNTPRQGLYKNEPSYKRAWQTKIPLGPEQSRLGWSITEFLLDYTQQEILEIKINDHRKYIIHNTRANTSKPFNSNSLNKLPNSLILLGDILGEINDIELNNLLTRISTTNHNIIAFDIMDSRWNKSFSPDRNFRDPEQYIALANKHGYSLKKYLKAPYKAAFEINYQLDSRATLLHLEKTKKNQTNAHD